jgi:hypothetical protein
LRNKRDFRIAHPVVCGIRSKTLIFRLLQGEGRKFVRPRIYGGQLQK